MKHKGLFKKASHYDWVDDNLEVDNHEYSEINDISQVLGLNDCATCADTKKQECSVQREDS